MGRLTSHATIVTSCLIATAAGLFHFVNFTFDDAFISFRYAENLVNGNGLVFNPGERVEGFSNPLWTLLLAVPILLGVDRFDLGLLATAKILGALVTLATVFVVARSANLLTPSRQNAALPLAPVIVATSAPVLAWGVSGLETPLVMLLIAVAVHVELVGHQEGAPGSRTGATVWLLAALSRPEPVLLYLVTCCWRFWSRPLAHHDEQIQQHGADPTRLQDTNSRPAQLLARVHQELPAWLVFAIPYTILLLTRRAYYGSWLPNTYYAKMHADRYLLVRGSDYLETAFETLHGNVLLTVSLFVIVAARRWTAPFALLCALVLTQVLLVLREGGDWMPGLRFLAPIVPLCALLVQHAWLSVSSLHADVFRMPTHVPSWIAPPHWVNTWRRWARTIEQASWSSRVGTALRAGTRLALVVACFASIKGSFDTIRVRNLESGFRRVELDASPHFTAARWMRDHLVDSRLLAIAEAGIIPYYTKLPVLDLFGLVDPHIARTPGAMHNKFDLAYVLSRSPEHFFLVGHRTADGTFNWDQNHSRTLNTSPEFQERYHVLREFRDGVLFQKRHGEE